MRYVTSFQIRDSETLLGASIDQLYLLSEYICTHNVFDIIKITFNIRDNENSSASCSIILRNRGEVFVPDENLEQDDWDLIAKALDYRNLGDQFVKYVRLPWT